MIRDIFKVALGMTSLLLPAAGSTTEFVLVATYQVETLEDTDSRQVLSFKYVPPQMPPGFQKTIVFDARFGVGCNSIEAGYGGPLTGTQNCGDVDSWFVVSANYHHNRWNTHMKDNYAEVYTVREVDKKYESLKKAVFDDLTVRTTQTNDNLEEFKLTMSKFVNELPQNVVDDSTRKAIVSDLSKYIDKRLLAMKDELKGEIIVELMATQAD